MSRGESKLKRHERYLRAKQKLPTKEDNDDYAFRDSPDDGRMTVKVRGADGESETVEVSVQNMSALDDRELTAAQFARLRGSSVGQKLAGVAEANAQNDDIKDAYTFSEGKEGTLRKANNVPVVVNNGSTITLEGHSGYVTRKGMVSVGYLWLH